jgi:tRNA(Ile)-lysidine synthase
LVAVSGGADSTALLLGTSRLSQPLGLTVEVASLDHGFRASAVSELEQVRQLSSRLGLPFHRRALSLAVGPSLEERARKARYAALEEIRLERGLDWIATAHTASDQAETLLMRLARGASLGGAAGILPTRGAIIRPLLACTRAEVERFLAGEGVGFANDPMNADPAFLRSRIRARVIPALEEAAGSPAIQHLAQFAAQAGEDAALLDHLAEEAFARLRLAEGQLDATGVRALTVPIQRRVLARLIGEAGGRIDLPTVDRAMAAARSGKTATLSKGLCLRAAGGIVRCSAAAPRPLEETEQQLRDRWITDPPSGLRMRLARTPPAGRDGLCLGIREVALPLSIRRRRAGDQVLGRAGRRKLQDVMVDLKLPSEQRDAIPVICDADGKIVWVVGVWPRSGRDCQRQGNWTWFLLAEPISGRASAEKMRSL